jgi:hypothetical protein
MEKTLPVSMLLDGSSDEEFKGLTLQGLPKMIWLLLQMLQRHHLCHLVQHSTVL